MKKTGKFHAKKNGKFSCEKKNGKISREKNGKISWEKKREKFKEHQNDQNSIFPLTLNNNNNTIEHHF